MSNYQVINQDVIEWAKNYTGPKAMAMLCDPPYHLTSINRRFSSPNSAPAKGDVYRRASAGFMGQDWDGLGKDGKGIAFKPETWAALAQHLYPGAFGMAFASSRGWHRMAVAIEDAGFIIHPSIFMLGWACGSKFPKATRIDTQVDREAGNERPDKLDGGHIGMGKYAGDSDNENELENRVPHVVGKGSFTNGTPIDPLAKIWASHRYGLQALKPALEPIIVFQRPYEGRPVDNITRTGAGALNIDGARIPTNDDLDGGGYMTPVSEGWDRPWRHNDDIREEKERIKDERVAHAQSLGRWPSNLLIHHNFDCQPGHCSESCPVERLGEQSGELTSGGPAKGRDNIDNFWTGKKGQADNPETYNGGDSGTAARYFFQADWSHEILEQLMNADPVFYTAKASKTERSAGLDKPNNHPTVKSLSLTKYLASLLLPPDAYAPRRILIPFAGVGSEMAGAVLAGWEEVVGIEKYPLSGKPIGKENPAYCDIARARLAWWSKWPGWGQTDVDKILQAANDKEAEAGQISLFDLLEAA